jgi:hypothetical protein
VAAIKDAGPPALLAKAAKRLYSCRLKWDDGNEEFDVAVNMRVNWVCAGDRSAFGDPVFVSATNPRLIAKSLSEGDSITLIGKDWVISDPTATKKDVPRFVALQKSIGGKMQTSFAHQSYEASVAATDKRQAANSYTEGDGVEYKWLKPTTFSCSYGTRCFGLMVRATEDCPSGVYVEINIMDKSGTVVDWSNDSVPALAAGRSAKMIFETFDHAGTKAQVATTTCHR